MILNKVYCYEGAAMRFLCLILFIFLVPSALSAAHVVPGSAHEFRLSPLREQDQTTIDEMTGSTAREKGCGRYVAFYGAPVTHAPQVLFAVARPSGEPFMLIGRRAEDITFRVAPEATLPSVVGVFADDVSVLTYVLYLPSEEFLTIRACLKPRQAQDDKDM